MKKHADAFGQMADEIELLLRAHALIQEKDTVIGRGAILGKHLETHLRMKSPELAGILNVCERLRKRAEWCDDDLLVMRERSFPKERCGDDSCPAYREHLVWDKDGCAVCRTSVEKEVTE